MTDSPPAPPSEAEEPQAKGEVAASEADELQRRELSSLGGGRDPWNLACVARLAPALPGGTRTADTSCEVFRAAVSGLSDIDPRTPVEGTLASLILAAHAAALECYSRAWADSQPFEARARYLAMADRSTRTVASLAEGLSRVRSGGRQTITVRHQSVHVADGGKAVVAGEVTAGRREGERGGDGRQ